MCFRPFLLKSKLFRFIFFWREQKPEGFTIMLRMFAVVNIVRMNHTLQIAASFFWSPSNPLMYNNIMKYEIKKAVCEDSQCDGYHVRIVTDLREIVKNPDGWQAEYKGKQVVPFERGVVNRVM